MSIAQQVDNGRGSGVAQRVAEVLGDGNLPPGANPGTTYVNADRTVQFGLVHGHFIRGRRRGQTIAPFQVQHQRETRLGSPAFLGRAGVDLSASIARHGIDAVVAPFHKAFGGALETTHDLEVGRWRFRAILLQYT